MPTVKVLYLTHQAEPPTRDCDGTEACCEALEVYVDGRRVTRDDELSEAAERMALATERFKEGR